MNFIMHVVLKNTPESIHSSMAFLHVLMVRRGKMTNPGTCQQRYRTVTYN